MKFGFTRERVASGHADKSVSRVDSQKPTQTVVKVRITGGGLKRWKEGVPARNLSQVPRTGPKKLKPKGKALGAYYSASRSVNTYRGGDYSASSRSRPEEALSTVPPRKVHFLLDDDSWWMMTWKMEITHWIKTKREAY